MGRNSDSKFLKGAFTLTIAGVIVKIIGALYRIPLYSLLGSEGMGLFQYAYPIYAILLTVSSAGLNVAISKVVAERLASGKRSGAVRAFNISICMMMVFGLIASLALYFSSGWIANNMAKDPRAQVSIAAISPALFFVAILAAFRGWFQGNEEMNAPAVSQVVEQMARLLTMFVLARYLLPRGVEYAASGATFGAVAGAGVALLYIGCIYFMSKKRWVSSKEERHEHWMFTARQVITIAIPISLASAVFGITELIDLGLVPGRLQAGGISFEQATRLYGQLAGAVFPLVNLPTIFTGALQMALVPSISAAVIAKDRESIKRRVSKALTITATLALPAALGLYILSEPIPLLIYKEGEIGNILRSVTPAVFFLAVQQVTAGILQGLGKLKIPLYNLIWAAFIKALLTYGLVAIPGIGILGAGIATSFHFATAALLNVWAIHKELGSSFEAGSIFKMALSGAIMSLFVAKVYSVTTHSVGFEAGTAAAILTGAIVYISMIFLFKVMDIKEIAGLFSKRYKE